MQVDATLTEARPPIRTSKSIVALVVLVLIADFLMFRQAPGINLFLFAVAVTAGILLAARVPPRLRLVGLWMGLAAFAALPLLIGPSSTGIAVAVVAVMLIGLAVSRLTPGNPARLPLIFCRFLAVAPLRSVEDLYKHARSRRKGPLVRRGGPGLGAWILPLVLAAVFLILFAMANPVIDDVLRSIDLRILWRFLDFWRITFWLAVAVGVWAVLRPRLLSMRKRASTTAAPLPQVSENVLLSHASILRSLIVFNAMFAVQTLLDLVYLWGGANLPDGMTHAQYAHRGAYPLIVTALLAGGFVLVAMRRGGPSENSAAVRLLVHAWIAQNILLCLSAILRLDLYVEIFSLTELRVAAGIWMGLVAIGLALILLRILFRRSNAWLIAMNLASLATVLYLTALVDIPGFIARFNVEHSLEVAQKGQPLDVEYLSSLGPSAIPALDLYIETIKRSGGGFLARGQAARWLLVRQFEKEAGDWRSWSLRRAAIAKHIEAGYPGGTNNGINGFRDIQYQLQ